LISPTRSSVSSRADILHRMVRWQLAKRQAGTHKTKGRSEIPHGAKFVRRRAGRCPSRQQAPRSSVGGGKAHGPVVRSHAMICRRRFALWLCACAVVQGKGQRSDRLDSADVGKAKTKALAGSLEKLG
jgi:large subunit ribosomal protein L4